MLIEREGKGAREGGKGEREGGGERRNCRKWNGQRKVL